SSRSAAGAPRAANRPCPTAWWSPARASGSAASTSSARVTSPSRSPSPPPPTAPSPCLGRCPDAKAERPPLRSNRGLGADAVEGEAEQAEGCRRVAFGGLGYRLHQGEQVVRGDFGADGGCLRGAVHQHDGGFAYDGVAGVVG